MRMTSFERATSPEREMLPVGSNVVEIALARFWFFKNHDGLTGSDVDGNTIMEEWINQNPYDLKSPAARYREYADAHPDTMVDPHDEQALGTLLRAVEKHVNATLH